MNDGVAARNVIQVTGNSDAGFVADKGDRKSETGRLVMGDGMLISRMCKKQYGVSLSTMEAEYTAAAVELLGVCELLRELKLQCEEPMKLRADNQPVVKQLEEEKASAKANHIEV
ncbi:LOW QUALITY PROTEIN: Gag-pol Polyprotein [Phytophthora megakarya]|uniref:Gag-pol Polyprotein n=1 Tax=Phytophthora megakarya TaxID=4795 RepID=A0A225WWV7_9STRA|nr:LOW QUALITY PROTEIN: Gag-pol Polyprotein [Phytophthora megakarya]